jgi:uncharacterized LabA/DUF88 family protein
MRKRLGVFVDVSNIYYCIGKKFEGRKLDYRKYLEFLDDLGDVVKAIAYGSQLNNEATGFVYALQQIGFQPKFKAVKSYRDGENLRRKADHDVAIAIDIVQMLDRFDIVILGTADSDLEPVVHYCTQRGVDVITFACGISRDLKASSTKFFEIYEALLENDAEDESLEITQG